MSWTINPHHPPTGPTRPRSANQHSEPAGEPQFVAQAVKCHTFFQLAVNHATQDAAAAALADPESDTYVTERAAALLDQGRRLVARLSAVPGLRVDVPPAGGFYVFVDVRGFAADRELGGGRDEEISRATADYLLHTVRTAVVAGDQFGEQGRGFVRMSFAGPEADHDLAIDRLLADTSSLPIKRKSTEQAFDQ